MAPTRTRHGSQRPRVALMRSCTRRPTPRPTPTPPSSRGYCRSYRRPMGTRSANVGMSGSLIHGRLPSRGGNAKPSHPRADPATATTGCSHPCARRVQLASARRRHRPDRETHRTTRKRTPYAETPCHSGRNRPQHHQGYEDESASECTRDESGGRSVDPEYRAAPDDGAQQDGPEEHMEQNAD
jgi:hypothetical protein